MIHVDLAPSCRYTSFLNDRRLVPFLIILFLAVNIPHLRAQETKEDLDAHVFRFSGLWFYSQPTESFHDTGPQGLFDVQKDGNFNSYHTGAGRVEWNFTRKNHLYLGFLSVNQRANVRRRHRCSGGIAE